MRRSRIESLPPEIQAALDELLREGVPHLEIVERLRGPLGEIGEEPLSKSGVGRYAKRVNEIARRHREGAEFARVLKAQTGDGEITGLSPQLVEMMRIMHLDGTIALDEHLTDPDIPVEKRAALLTSHARSLKLIEEAGAISARRERQIRQDQAERAADAVAAEAGKHGLSAAVARALRDATQRSVR